MNPSLDIAVTQLKNRFDPAAVLLGDDVRQRPVSKQIAAGCQAAALLRPASTEEVAEMVRICAEHRIPIVPRAGMTGLVGGTVAESGEIALSLERMSGVVSVDPDAQTMVVNAGTPLQAVHDAAAGHGFQFPLDLGARGSATIGGMLSTNAGGNKVLRYGMIREMVLGLEVVLPDGRVMDAMSHLMKNNTGLDLKHLYIGTEGTLGIITRAVLKLYPRTPLRNVALCAFDSFEAMVATLNHMRKLAGPALTSYEVMWRSYLQLVTEPGRLRSPLSRDHSLYALIECEYADGGPAGAGHAELFSRQLMAAMEAGWVEDAVIAQSESDSNALWHIRDEVHYLRELSPVFIFDVSLPIVHMPGYLESLQRELDRRWPENRFICYGHVGDGNLHVAVSCGEASDAESVAAMVYEPLQAIGGSISAEHGIGLYKKPYLEFSRNAVERDVMRRVKAALDPHNLLNPGKIL